jgi:phosphate transport system permease protein
MYQPIAPGAASQDREGRDLPVRRRPPERRTRRAVIVADRLADWTIRIGGILVIIAVLGIMVFLAEVVVPLFTGGDVIDQRPISAAPAAGRTLFSSVDEYKTISVSVTEAGAVAAFHLATGTPLAAPAFDFAGRRLTAFAGTLSGRDVAFGFADGTVAFGTLTIDARVLAASALPRDLQRLSETDGSDGSVVYATIPGGQVRSLAVKATLGEPQQIAPLGVPIRALDYRLGGTVERPTRSFVSVDGAGTVRLSRAESRVNLLTNETSTAITTAELPNVPDGIEVADLLMTESADQVYVAERSGVVRRFDTRNFNAPKLAETRDILPGETQLTAFTFLIGEQSIVAGGSDGSVNVYFRLQRPAADTADGYALVLAHRLEPHAAAVTAIDASQRSKIFVTADAEGHVWLRHSTSEQTLLKLPSAGSGPVRYTTVVLAPRDNGVLALSADGSGRFWDVSVPHPETTLGSIFGKVWYEGYPEPVYTWQSSSGTDSFEPKLSLVPLIFGTVKATFYSLLFAIPIALLAAIYTSEFVHYRVRAVIKPVMEMMASLPSVVLGFIAALILAPIVETWIAAVLLAFVALPLTLIAAAYVWQLLPVRMALRYGGVPKFALMFVVLALGIWLAYGLGPAFENLFFAGDVKAWANGDVGTGTPFMALLLMPVCLALVFWGAGRGVGARLSDHMRRSPRLRAGAIDIVRWLVIVGLSALLAWILASLLAATGYDPRGGVVDTYVQRNTLVVGFAMGFAVIPIIYTIAEDALNSVPEHLRGASLACGATPWQMATTVILPTAVSGVFAAIMIGMGRAVGETMIVVMAAGNTPILEWNIFNGLRALSANIAVELPEAVKDGTLYRMLFLAGLTLFVMTFVINTGAEVIRQRFRKRAAQL